MTHCKTEAVNKRVPALTQQGFTVIPMLLILLTVLAACAAVWQWQRSQYHTAQAQTLLSQQAQIRNLNLTKANTASHGAVSGNWLPDSTVYIAPRLLDGRMGALVVSVLSYVDATGAARFIAVQRGWAAQTQPNQAPKLAALTTEQVSLQGHLVNALPHAYELKPAVPQQLGLWQNHDLAIHGALLQRSLDPNVLVLSPESADAERLQLRRIPAQQAVDTLLQKASSNRAYAFQWLAIALVGVFGLGWMWRNRFKRN